MQSTTANDTRLYRKCTKAPLPEMYTCCNKAHDAPNERYEYQMVNILLRVYKHNIANGRSTRNNVDFTLYHDSRKICASAIIGRSKPGVGK